MPGPTGDRRSVSELVASLAARSCLLDTQLAVESLEGARESCCADAKDDCAGDEEPLYPPCINPGEREGIWARGASCGLADSRERK